MSVNWRSRLSCSRRLTHGIVVAALVIAICQPAAAVDDVLLQTQDGKIVAGTIDDDSFVGSLGERVHRQQFLSNFRSANPGFVSLATGSLAMPPGAAGFPSNHDVSFDLLPMTIEQESSNLFYWDAIDQGDDGLDASDVNFVRPVAVAWEVLDANSSTIAVHGTDDLVSGGLIQRTSADINPSDGIDTGAIHKHLVLQLNDNDGDSETSPAQGVYMIAWQARSLGFETSDPFLFVMRTSMISNTARDVAADWAIANLDMLTSPPLVLLGDYNEDGAVDAADYTVWRDSLGTRVATAGAGADGDFSGEVDAGDYSVWKQNFARTIGSSSGAATAVNVVVPEPCGLLSATIAATTAVLFRRRIRAPSDSIRRA